MRTLSLTLVTSERASKLHPKEVSDADLTDTLTTSKVGEKDGPAIIPAVFRPCPAQCLQHGIPKRVDCGGGKLHRLNANVEAMTGLALDLDDLSRSTLDDLVAGVRSRGVEFYYWETYSHAPPTECRARLFIPFAEPMPIPSVEAWKRGAWPALLRFFELTGNVDQSCSDTCRVYYTPRKPNEGDERDAYRVDGKRFAWQTVVDLKGFTAAALVTPRAPVEDPTKEVDLEGVRARLKELRDGTGMIAKLLKGEPLTPPPLGRPRGAPSRYIAWRHVTAVLSNVVDEADSTEALLEVLRPSWHAEVEDAPHDHTDWGTVEQLLDFARASAPQHKAKREAERAATRNMIRALCLDRFGKDIEAEGVELVTGPADSEEESDAGFSEGVDHEEAGFDPKALDALARARGFDWTKQIQWTQDKDGNDTGFPAPSFHNLVLVLTHSPKWKGVFRFNSFKRRIDVCGPPFLEADEPPRPFEDVDVTAVRISLGSDKVIPLRPKKEEVFDAINYASKSNAYDPLADYLNGLEWDGTSRADTFLEEYLGAELTSEDGRDVTGYVRAVSRRWLVGLAARGLVPGIMLQTVVHLEGKQGIGKSRSLEALAGGPAFYSATAIDFRNKDSYVHAATNWIVELGELSTFRKSEVNEQKNFLSASSDTYRAVYERTPVTTGRRCVFVGTTNEGDYLTDVTGNRRHWPVKLSDRRIDVARIAADRDLILAEAVALFKAGEPFHLSPEEGEAAELETAQRAPPDALAEQVQDKFARLAFDQRPAYIRLSDILDEMNSRGMGGTVRQVEMVRALLVLGFDRRVLREGGQQFRVFITPPSVLSLPRKSAQLASVAKALESLTSTEKAKA